MRPYRIGRQRGQNVAHKLFLDQAAETQNRGHRRAQFVRDQRDELIFHLRQLYLLGHVTQDGDDAGNRIGTAAEGAGQRPVGPPLPDNVGSSHQRGLGLSRGDRRRQRCIGQHLGQRPADQGGRVTSGDRGERRVQQHNLRLQVGHHQPVRHVLQDRVELGVLFGQVAVGRFHHFDHIFPHLSQLMLGGDVAQYHQAAPQRTARIAQRRDRHLHPAAIGVLQADFLPHGLLGLLLGCQLQRLQHDGRQLPDQRRPFQPQQPVRCRIDLHDAALVVQDNDAVLHTLQHGTLRYRRQIQQAVTEEGHKQQPAGDGERKRSRIQPLDRHQVKNVKQITEQRQRSDDQQKDALPPVE